MNLPSISLKKTLNVAMNDAFARKNELSDKDSQLLTEEYKEWLEAYEEGKDHHHVLYLNHLKPNSFNQ